MSLILIEGFDGLYSGDLDVTTELNRIHPFNDVGSPVRVESGRDGGHSIRYASNTGWFWLYPPGREVNDTWFVGFNLYIQDAINTSNPFFRLQQAGYAGYGDGIQLQFNSNDGIDINDGDGNLLVSSTNNVLALNTWHHVELKAVCSSSSGEVELKVDGSTQATGNNLDTNVTGNANWSAVIISAAGNTLYNPYYDDLYVCNDQGTDNNDFLGECYVRTIRPSSDADPNDGTPSSGTDHYAMVDEDGPDDDSTTLELTSNSDKEMFGFESLSVNGPILGLSLTSLARAGSSCQMKLRNVFKSGTVETSLDSQRLTYGGNYLGIRDLIETNPDTGSAWSQSEVNSGEFGFELDTQ